MYINLAESDMHVDLDDYLTVKPIETRNTIQFISRQVT